MGNNQGKHEILLAVKEMEIKTTREDFFSCYIMKFNNCNLVISLVAIFFNKLRFQKLLVLWRKIQDC